MVAAANTPLLIPKRSQDGILMFHKQCYNMLNTQWNIREQMRKVDLAYIRENNLTTEHQRAKLVNTYGNPSKYQDVVIPVVMPQVESAVTYQASVFLTGVPLFDVVAVPQFEDQALQMSAILEDNSTRGGWARELMMFFRDGAKYNLAALEVVWKREVTAALETNVSFSSTQGKPKEVIWEGNSIRRMDMYNTFFDSRCAPAEIPKKGEFAGYTELMSRIELKAFIAAMPDKMVDNIKPAFESGMGSATVSGSSGGIESFYVPQINPDALLDRNPKSTTDWAAWAGLTSSGSRGGVAINYKNMYEVTTLYGRILPSDFDLRVPSANTPQIWKFVIVNHQVIIYAERQTNAHAMLPMLFAQPNEDGLRYQTKSLAQNVKPMQEVATALMSANMAARRRAISDRGLYDPSRVTEANINSDNPSAKIPVRPAAYGKPVQDAYYSIPFKDDQQVPIMQQISQLMGYADIISGRNKAQQGQFVKGNKTLHEYEDVMAHASGRDQMTAMLYEAQLFTPMKEMFKLNILQYQAGVSIYSPSKDKTVKIDPVALRQAVINFKVSDGLIPADKLINADTLQSALQVIGSSPEINSAYNIGPMFSYLMKTQGANISDFEKSPQQVAFEQASQQWSNTLTELMKANPQITPQQYPPQPVPAQYGYIPGAPSSQQGQPPTGAKNGGVASPPTTPSQTAAQPPATTK